MNTLRQENVEYVTREQIHELQDQPGFIPLASFMKDCPHPWCIGMIGDTEYRLIADRFTCAVLNS